jgi:hypothetical protein
VSTTLMPPSFYAVRQRGRPAYIFETVREAAAALFDLAPAVTVVYAVTGSHRRSLSERELLEVGRHVKARRMALTVTSLKPPPQPSPAAHPVKKRRGSRSAARSTAATRMRVPPLLDVMAVQDGLAAGLRNERHERGAGGRRASRGLA